MKKHVFLPALPLNDPAVSGSFNSISTRGEKTFSVMPRMARGVHVTKRK